VFPSFRIILSETRTPDSRWEHGYARRLYSESPTLGFSNGSWSPVAFALSFWRAKAQVYLEFGFGGTLAGHEGDEVRLLDHPGLTLSDLGSATSGDFLNVWSGWFEVYASAPMQVTAWNEIYDKGETEVHGHRYVRTLDRFEAAMPRPDLEFPDVPGRPSVVWRAQGPPAPAPAPSPTEEARCPSLRESIQNLTAEIAALQADLNVAEPGEKQGLTARIKKLDAERKPLIVLARSIGCRGV